MMPGDAGQQDFASDVSGLYPVGIDVAVHHGIDCQSRYGLDTQFLHNVLAVGDDGGEADVQFVGNLLVDKSFGDEHQHFYLAGGKFVGIGVAGGMRRHGGAETVRLLVGVSVLVSVPMELQNVFCEAFVRPDRCLASACPTVGDGFTIDQHNGFGLALQKESGMLEVNL